SSWQSFLQERPYATAYWPFSVRESCTSNANPPLPETKIFKPISVDKYHNIASPPRGTLRNIDGEYKLLETIAQQLGNNRNVSGRIDLFTELKACQSCSNVILEFRNRYPNIQLNIFTGK
ncbi:deaminase domain-containing protein, partial [Neisseria meningitidis]